MLLSRALLKRHSVLPGFDLALGFTLLYLSFIVLLPLSAAFLKTFDDELAGVLGRGQRAARPCLLPAHLRRLVCGGGSSTPHSVCIVCWVLVRYEFPGRRLSTRSSICLSRCRPRSPASPSRRSIPVTAGSAAGCRSRSASRRVGVWVALTFIGLPFVVRTLQPVLEDLQKEVEEAAAVLGATRWQTFRRVIFPTLTPALLTGFALAFARALGEYGSVIFIAGNLPMVSEITPLLIITKLEQFDVAGRHRDRRGHARRRVPPAAGDQWAAGVDAIAAGAMSSEAGALAASVGSPAAAPTLAPPRVSDATTEPTWLRRTLIAVAFAFLAVFLFVPLLAVFVEALKKGVGVYLGRDQRARRALGDPTDAARRRDLGAAQPRLRARRRVVDRQVRLPRQEPAAHPHRPAVLGQPGDRRVDLRPRLRPAGLVRAPGCATTT